MSAMLPKAFAEKISAALANDTLQAALDANAARRLTARRLAMAELPDYPARRRAAHAVRAEVVLHLEDYRDQFVRQAQANGLQVHLAQDAAQAGALVLEIAQAAGARLAAKSKTMLSEEIGLNRTIEAAGLEVVETDLGEYIVQLRGEHPAHLITPAVHLRRADVARTFQEKLGVPYNEDIPTMTALARQRLRQVFLQAGVGISGVNFGVAQTGMLCVLSNEGNARMVATLPPVHIALMGLERIVPGPADLALMLSLLPRAATGQKMTVYASLLHGPRRTGDPDGPGERHLVLVDNGRLAASQGPLAEMLYCIRCGACLNACPVFRELGGHAYVGTDGEQAPYPGPIGSVLSPGLLGAGRFGHLARASSLCGACREACPVEIDLPGLLLRVRAGLPAEPAAPPAAIPRPLQAGLKLFTWLALAPPRFHLTQKAAGLFARLWAPGSQWLRLPAFTGWGYSKDFPRPALRPFHERFQARPPGEAESPLELPAHSLPAGWGDVPPVYPANLAPGEDLLERFCANWQAAGGGLARCRWADLPSRLADFVLSAGEASLVCAEPGLPQSLLQALARLGVRLAGPEDAAEARFGLTGVAAASADPAALLLAGGPGRALTASLLPEIHLALVSAGQVQPGLEQLLALPALRQSAAAALVCGPSRTADIEMTLTVGVHGPKAVQVVLIEDAPGEKLKGV